MTAVAIIGAGQIGSGWAALFAAHGFEVRVLDPDADAAARVGDVLDRARALGVQAAAERLRFVDDVRDAVTGAAWVQESVPEDLALKTGVLRSLADHLHDDAVVASSTSSCTATELGSTVPYAERLLIVHPLHPVYLVPVMEVCAGERTSRGTVARALEMMRAVGREPLQIHGDPRGLVSNRLTAALLREALELVVTGALSAYDLDRLVMRGVATGWMAAGVFGTELAGSEGGDDDGRAAADRVRRHLGAIFASLADWPEMSARHAAVLERAMSRDASTRAYAHSWDERLARLLDGTR